jgi:hypothetical protein
MMTSRAAKIFEIKNLAWCQRAEARSAWQNSQTAAIESYVRALWVGLGDWAAKLKALASALLEDVTIMSIITYSYRKAYLSHNLKVIGSNPIPATKIII